MSQGSNLKLTSVEVDEHLLREFKVLCLKDKFSLQKLVSRSLYLYITDKDFRDKILTQYNTNLKDSE